jgi:hypothetical protein
MVSFTIAIVQGPFRTTALYTPTVKDFQREAMAGASGIFSRHRSTYKPYRTVKR